MLHTVQYVTKKSLQPYTIQMKMLTYQSLALYFPTHILIVLCFHSLLSLCLFWGDISQT